jgi:tRNA-modifying protein YgfZ
MTDMGNNIRSIITVSGEDRIHFLQGILTQDVSKLAVEKIQFAALLSPQGKILHDMFLIAQGDRILIDTPAAYKDVLMKRLAMYKLRAKVTVADAPEYHVSYSKSDGMADPRHPALPHRIYSNTALSDISETDYRGICLQFGIPDSAHDFAPDILVPLDAGYDLLNAISFTKGCYVGQEVTARMHYKNIARRGFYILESDVAAPRLALLKFEEAEKITGHVMIDGTAYHPRLPKWMLPKLAQHKANSETAQ